LRNADDHAWLDALAGRHGHGSAPGTAEGVQLRSALLSRPAVPVEPVAGVDPARELQLLERARREGLLPDARWRWGRGLGLVATLLLSVSVGLLVLRPGEPPVIERGAGDVLRLFADDPLALRTRLLAELQAAGVDATSCERLGLLCIDAEFDMPPTPAVLELLARHGIPVPVDGVLLIEFVGPEPAR
jgi:hypothetical protein